MTVLKRVTATESSVQEAVARHFDSLRHDIIVPNISAVFGWEADVLSVNPKRIAHEVEIKVSRSDWLRELSASADMPEQGVNESNKLKWQRHQHLKGNEPTTSPSGWINTPSYFWVAAPTGVVLDDELPSYCGFLLYDAMGGVNVTVNAPRLHTHPLTDKQWRAMARGISLRYWRGRND